MKMKITFFKFPVFVHVHFPIYSLVFLFIYLMINNTHYMKAIIQLCLTLMVSKLMVDSHYVQYFTGNGRNMFKIVSIFWLIQLQVMVSSLREHQPLKES